MRQTVVPSVHGDLPPEIIEVPIAQIRIQNSRARNAALFERMVKNISGLGLKRPITVRRLEKDDGGYSYDLICGQGRLEAVSRLGEVTIPAIVVDATTEELFLMSLVENIARRKRSSIELLGAILEMSERGHTAAAIGRLTSLDAGYVASIIELMRHGEERLIAAVEQEIIPLRIAIKIASSSDREVQALLMDAYEGGQLKGNALIQARRVIEKRRSFGKAYGGGPGGDGRLRGTRALVKSLQNEIRRQQLAVRRTELNRERFALLVGVFRQLHSDPNFVDLLRLHGFNSIPKVLEETLSQGAR